MKILVMGGTRFFGKLLVSKLLQQGENVTILNRGKSPDDFGDKVSRIVMNRENLDKNHPVLAAQNWDVVYDQICFDAGEAKAACKLFKGKTRRYIMTSSQSVYRDGAKLSESDFNPQTFKIGVRANRDKDYGEAKRQAEATFFQNDGFPITAVRFPNVLGPDDYTGRLKLHATLVKELKPIVFPNLEAKISFVQSEDAAAFLAFLAKSELSGPVNCCSFEPISLRNLIREIERAVMQKSIITNNPEKGKASPFGIEVDWYMDASKARDAGFEAMPIKDWLPGLIRQISS